MDGHPHPSLRNLEKRGQRPGLTRLHVRGGPAAPPSSPPSAAQACAFRASWGERAPRPIPIRAAWSGTRNACILRRGETVGDPWISVCVQRARDSEEEATQGGGGQGRRSAPEKPQPRERAGLRGRPRGACGASREASGSAGGLPASCGPRRPRAPSSSPLPPLPCPPSPLRTGRPCPSFSLFSGRRQSLGLTLFLLPFLQMVLRLACFGPVSPSFSFWPLLPASRPPPGFCPSEGASACL